jgi:hypothetical protein
VNGTPLSTVATENQISMLRGNAGTSISLQVSRGGESISLLAKRASISVQDLRSSDVSAWFGKSKSIGLEELNYLASQKVGEGYELLGVMRQGLLVDSDMENLNPQAMQHISLKKEAAQEDVFVGAHAPTAPKAGTLNFANRSAISFSLANETAFARIAVLNVKGAVVWQKNLGRLPAGANEVDWGVASLPAGSYHARLEAGGVVLVHKFELRQ